MTTQRLTMAQALVRYLSRQYVSRDGSENRFFAGMWGIFGHGNVAGVGQALEQYAPDLRYYQSRNEQAQVLASVAYAKHKKPTLRLRLRLVHRSRRHQHDHRRGGGDGQSHSGAAPAR